jgi:hypothetical protein
LQICTALDNLFYWPAGGCHSSTLFPSGVIVLTYRLWSTVFKKDPGVIGKTVRLSSIGDRSATVIGVLEPCVPYPADTEIISNVVTSPSSFRHHGHGPRPSHDRTLR